MMSEGLRPRARSATAWTETSSREIIPRMARKTKMMTVIKNTISIAIFSTS